MIRRIFTLSFLYTFSAIFISSGLLMMLFSATVIAESSDVFHFTCRSQDGSEDDVVLGRGNPPKIKCATRTSTLGRANIGQDDPDNKYDSFRITCQTGEPKLNILSTLPECSDGSSPVVEDLDEGSLAVPPVATTPPGSGGAATGRFECTGDACVTDNPITRFLITVVNFLSALVGIIVIAVIIIAGIQYTTSGGNPQQAAQAKKRIINAVTALVAFFFLFAILQWLIPGGIFKS